MADPVATLSTNGVIAGTVPPAAGVIQGSSEQFVLTVALDITPPGEPSYAWQSRTVAIAGDGTETLGAWVTIGSFTGNEQSLTLSSSGARIFDARVIVTYAGQPADVRSITNTVRTYVASIASSMTVDDDDSTAPADQWVTYTMNPGLVFPPGAPPATVTYFWRHFWRPTGGDWMNRVLSDQTRATAWLLGAAVGSEAAGCTVRVRDYIGFRYNTLTITRTEAVPPPETIAPVPAPGTIAPYGFIAGTDPLASGALAFMGSVEPMVVALAVAPEWPATVAYRVETRLTTFAADGTPTVGPWETGLLISLSSPENISAGFARTPPSVTEVRLRVFYRLPGPPPRGVETVTNTVRFYLVGVATALMLDDDDGIAALDQELAYTAVPVLAIPPGAPLLDGGTLPVEYAWRRRIGSGRIGTMPGATSASIALTGISIGSDTVWVDVTLPGYENLGPTGGAVRIERVAGLPEPAPLAVRLYVQPVALPGVPTTYERLAALGDVGLNPPVQVRRPLEYVVEVGGLDPGIQATVNFQRWNAAQQIWENVLAPATVDAASAAAAWQYLRETPGPATLRAIAVTDEDTPRLDVSRVGPPDMDAAVDARPTSVTSLWHGPPLPFDDEIHPGSVG